MADPLSITASAAGLVSLGFQVVGGIMKYLDAVHEREDDVASAKQQVTRTHELLQCVTKVAAKIEQNHNTTATFLKDSSSIQKELQALDEIVQSLSPANASPQNQKVLGKVYVQAKKLTYPFHRPTMDRLQSRLTRVNEMLQAALQVSILDITIDIEGDTSAIKTTLRDSTISRQIAEQLKHETVASRDALTRVGDSVASLSSGLDQSLAKGLEDIATSTIRSLSVLHQGRADNQVELLHELSLTQGSVSGLRDVVKGVDMGVLKIQEDVATNSNKLMSTLRKDYADTQIQVFQELATTTSGISGLSDHLKRVDLALRALPTREELGRLISKPGELKGLCEVLEKTTEATSSRHFGHRPRIDPFRATCFCRKRVIRSRKALMLGPWQASADVSATHDHSTDCPCHFPDVSVTSKRLAVAFKGLQGLINRAIELSFTCSFGAGGCSLSPGFTYYPTVDRRRDPAFRIMGLFGWAISMWNNSEPGIEGFLEQCMKNMALLYRDGRAAPRAVDQYGRGVLHYFDELSTRYLDKNTLLGGIDTLLKHGVQATMYDTYGSTPAWNITCLAVWPGAWDTDGENRFYGPENPLNWDSGSLLTEFLCATDPCVTIVNESLLEHSTTSTEDTAMSLFGMMQRSAAIAEAFGCGPLSLAALEGDSHKIELILAKYPKAISERNLLNQTPLHLAIGHASCVALLLRGPGGGLIDVTDRQGRRPVEYALSSCLWKMGPSDNQYHHGCSRSHGDTSLNVLLDKGCMMPKQTFWRFASGYISLCTNCQLVFSKHLVRRRESLKMLAKSHLPEELAVELGIYSPYLLDSNACRVVHDLTHRGVHVPIGLQMHTPGESCDETTSVYHSYGLLSFSVLWEIGFRDLDQPDKNGLTPLMYWSNRSAPSSLARCSWLIEKGANFRRFVPHGPSTVSHQIHAAIGKFPRHWKHNHPALRRHVLYLTKMLSGQRLNPCVHCHCACSHGGCTPFVQFLHGAFESIHQNSASETVKKLPGIIMDTHTSVEKAEIRSAIRYATFQMLGIRHTCCHWSFDGTFVQRVFHKEAEELRQEDSFLVTILDDLVTEFEKELPLQHMCQEDFQKESISFWPKYWLPRVQEVLDSLDGAGIEESDKVAAEDFGVVWQTQESGKEKDCDEDSDSTSWDGLYHESDWDSEVDAKEMFDSFRTMGDWNSRLDLIMLKAGLPKPQA